MAVQQQLREGECLFAYLDDIYAIRTRSRADCGGPIRECVVGLGRDKHPPGQDEDVEPRRGGTPRM